MTIVFLRYICIKKTPK